MRKDGLMQYARTVAVIALLGAAACSDYAGTERWEGVYKPEAEIDRPKGLPMPMAMDAGRSDGGAADGAAPDGATVGDATAPDAGTGADAAPAADAADGDAAPADAAAADAAPADATPAG